MNAPNHPPHFDVKADLSAITEYRDAVDVFYSAAAAPLLADLGDLLAHRTGWHFAADSSGLPIWNLGSFSGSVLNVTITDDLKYHCYDHQADTDDDFATIREVAAWVDANEERALELLKQRQRGTFSQSDWYVFKIMEYRLDVDWFDDHYAASVFGIPMDAAFATTFPGVIQAGRELVIDWFGAPAELADALKVTATLTVTAVAHAAAEGPAS